MASVLATPRTVQPQQQKKKQLAVDQSPAVRNIGDAEATRTNIYDGVLQAARNIEPLSNKRHTLRLTNVDYADEGTFSLQEQKAAILGGKSLHRRLRGDWELFDNETGQLVERKRATLAHVPFFTARGTMIRNGNEYTLCLHGTSKIWTEQGMLPIRQIVEQQLRLQVWSYNFEKDCFELRPIIGWYKNPVQDGMGRSVFSSQCRMSSNYPRFTSSGLWATPGHDVFDLDGNKRPIAEAACLAAVVEKLSYTQNQLLYGTLLGDAHVRPDGRYQCLHGPQQEEYARLKETILSPVVNERLHSRTNKQGHVSWRFRLQAHPAFHTARRIAYRGRRKIVSSELLDQIDDMGLAFWFGDDGEARYTCNTNHVVAVFHTQSLSLSEIDLLREWLKAKWGLDTYTERNEASYGSRDCGWIICLAGENAEALLDTVAPYLPPCLHYKLLVPPTTKSCRACGKLVQPARAVRSNCLLRQWRQQGKSFSKTARCRFGSTQTIRDLPTTTTELQEDDGTARWQARRTAAGSALIAMQRDVALRFTLEGIPTEYQENTGRRYESTRTAYDIQVEGNHNYIANGVLVSNSNQMRMRPGIYTRIKDNGEIEAHANILPGKGAAHRYFLDPEKGVFKIRIGQANLPLMPVLRALGVSDRQLREAWGNELYQANAVKDDPAALNKLYQRLARRPDAEADSIAKRAAIAEALQSMEMDADVNQRTLGQPFDRISLDSILATTKKLLAVSRGEQDVDDRDHLAFQTIMGPEDLFSERVSKDYGGLRRQLFRRASLQGNLRHIQPGALSKQLEAAILHSGLGQAGEEVNPGELLDKLTHLSRMGEGGIPSIDAVPDEARSVQPSHLSFIDPVRTPESFKVGVDAYISHAAKKGNDGRIYSPFVDAKTREIVHRSPQDLADLTIAFPKAMDLPTKRVPAMRKGQLGYYPKSEVDVIVPHFENAFSPLGAMVPMKSAIKAQRMAMASRMFAQALPVENPEAPLVQSGIPDEDGSFESKYGSYMGAIRAKQGGRVLSTDVGRVRVRYDDGTTEDIELYNNHPFNRKTFIHNTTTVRPGDTFTAGQTIARSNYTDESGTTALGKNARVAYIPVGGKNFEDAIVVSEAFAQRMKSEHMYQHGLDLSDDYKTDKADFIGIFPGRFNRKTLAQLDDNGVIREGTEINYGDPLILAARRKEHSKSKVHRKRAPAYSDATVTWEHSAPGVVTDVFKSPKGVNVVVKSTMSLQEGDKLSGRMGDKGVVVILPDSQMPTDADGNPYEVALNPLGIISRTNPSQMIEAALGKIAAKTGKPIIVRDFEDIDDLTEYAEAELEKHGLKSTEDVFDQETGRRIPGIATGNRFFMKLHHTAEGKLQGRGTGGYTMEGTPAKGGESGSKALSLMDNNALLSHGATEVARDAGAIRGQRNEEFWLPFLQGYNPPLPKIPLVYQKFVNSLKAAGINVIQDGMQTHIMAMTDEDVRTLSGNRVITSGETVRFEKGMEPVKGGLFDETLTGGHNGNRWSYIPLAEPMPNPVMEEPIRRILGLTSKQLESVIAGRENLGTYGTGPQAISTALSRVNVDKAIETARAHIKSGRKTLRDNAVRRLGYLKSAKKLGIHPGDWMLSRVPVLPPKFRPVSVMSDKRIPLVSDANYLYKELLDANDNLTALRGEAEDVGDERLALYNSFKAVTGLGDPVHPKLREKKVRGILKHVFGSSPKLGTLQRRLLSSTVDIVGRAVITPNPDLDMDHVGLPENRAWDVYRNFVVRRLKRRGMPLVRALQAVEDRTPLAKQEMLKEMESRPVIINRAPVLHRFGIMAFYPKLVKGDTLQVSPLVVGGFNADFDGDAMQYHVPVSDEAAAEAQEKMLPSRNLLSPADFRRPVHKPSQEYTGGLYAATTRRSGRQTRTFRNIRDATAAYRRGELEIDDEVEILT